MLQDQQAHDYSENNFFKFFNNRLMTLIKTHQLVKSYGIGEQTVHPPDGVSVSIDQGEFVAIVGTSGSGK